jgi:hypothetical protein
MNYEDCFGEEYLTLNNLTNGEVSYVLDSIQFDKIMKEKRSSIPMFGSRLRH